MDGPTISEFDKARREYEEEMFEITHHVTPSELRSIIATRRIMEERIGTNGSIGLTMKISASVLDCMKALDEHQTKRLEDLQKELGDYEEPDEDDEEEDDEDDD
jgi:hypothetical protein